MACCCKPGGRSNKATSICLGRCELPKHRCLDKEDVKPGPVPKHMGWLYTAKDSPEHQLRCGWRPGHISCEVLKRIELHNCMKADECSPCSTSCSRPPCYSPCSKPCFKSCYKPCPKPKPCFKPCPSPRSCFKPCYSPKPCCAPPSCLAVCPSSTSCCKSIPPNGQPLIRIIRHCGQYSICTKPSNISNAPSGPYPLKYVLNTDESESSTATNVKYSVEAKFNDYQFDYTSSQSSFVLDFTPPEPKCYKPCPKKSVMCMLVSVEDNWPGRTKKNSDKKHKSKDTDSENSCCALCPEKCTPSCTNCSTDDPPEEKKCSKSKKKRKKTKRKLTCSRCC